MTGSPIYFSSDEDPRMAAAYRRARESFGVFWREMSWERRRIVPGLRMATIKAAFAVPEHAEDAPSAEHMWIENISFDGRVLAGDLVNTAGHIPGLVAGTPVTVAWEQVEDWMYVPGDLTVCGGFTVQATRADLEPAARAEHDAAWGLPFLDPDEIALTPDQVTVAAAPQRAARGWGRLLRGSKEPAPAGPRTGLPFEEALARARAAEHPMSVNSTHSIEQQLAAEPSAARLVLDDGHTLLHVDALGGNLGPVQALLRAGADPDARTPQGDTALDLAERMGWPRVAEALRSR